MTNEEQHEKKDFAPVIRGSDVITLKIDGYEFLLRRSIPLTIFTEKVLPLLNELDEYMDLTLFCNKAELNKVHIVEEWDAMKFNAFWINLSKIQKTIIQILLEKKHILRQDLLDQLATLGFFPNIDNPYKRLAGAVAGMVRKWNQENLTPIFIISKDSYNFNPILKSFVDNITLEIG